MNRVKQGFASLARLCAQDYLRARCNLDPDDALVGISKEHADYVMHPRAGLLLAAGDSPATRPLQNLDEVKMAEVRAHRARNHGLKRGTGEQGHVEYDEPDFKNRLSDEYKILQDKIDKIGGFRFTIKGWSITAVVAGIGIAGQKGLATGCTVAIGLVVMLVFFFILEHEQVRQSRIFGDRAGRIEDAFRRIRRGKGEEVFASLPVPYLAHELVIAKLRERAKEPLRRCVIL